MAGQMLKAVETFLESAEAWLTDEDAPAVAGLRAAAEALDEETTSALLNSYGLMYRALLKRKPAEDPEEDELAVLLREASETPAPTTNDARMDY